MLWLGDGGTAMAALRIRDDISSSELRRVHALPLQQRLRARARERAVEWRDINGLVPYARNARTHSEAQIAQIAGSIREFGFTNPVLIDPEGGIIAGCGRGARQRRTTARRTSGETASSPAIRPFAMPGPKIDNPSSARDARISVSASEMVGGSLKPEVK
jgi:hypothetical protein